MLVLLSKGCFPKTESETKVKLELSRLTKNKIDYFVVCVNDFADMYGMSYVEAFDYLKKHKGLAFLSEHYDIEHTYSVEETIADLKQVCERNGGRAA